MAQVFKHERGSPSHRMRGALSGIGMSVAKGRVSISIGVIALASAPAKVFRPFFQLIFSTVMLGMVAGLVFFLVCTILLGQWILSKENFE